MPRQSFERTQPVEPTASKATPCKVISKGREDTAKGSEARLQALLLKEIILE